ncbi:MAG: SET domain-containing protein, partial [Candidatus Binataceae bacterium]
YLYEINSRWTIDGTPRSNLARYANHSCNPNAETYDVRHRVFIRALRNIMPGEEIVYDYGIDYLKNVIGRSNCKCGRCRRRRARKARERRAALKR